jgi:hypothetical protein
MSPPFSACGTASGFLTSHESGVFERAGIVGSAGLPTYDFLANDTRQISTVHDVRDSASLAGRRAAGENVVYQIDYVVDIDYS